jgi:hypothetical protein
MKFEDRKCVHDGYRKGVCMADGLDGVGLYMQGLVQGV